MKKTDVRKQREATETTEAEETNTAEEVGTAEAKDFETDATTATGAVENANDDKRKREKAPSIMQQKLNKLIELQKNSPEKLTHREVLRHLGGSFSTVAKLMRQLELMKVGVINIEVVVSEETMQAVRNDVSRHLEIQLSRLNEKVEMVEQAMEDIESLTSAFDSLIHGAISGLDN